MTDAVTTNFGWSYPTVNADDSTWGTTLNTTVQAIDTQMLATANLPKKNLLINGNFEVNQSVVSGTVTLTAGQYGHDGWKAGASGCTYTFGKSGTDTTLTISAGSLVQFIPGAQIFSASNMLSQAGTAQARAYQGSPTGAFAACPLAVTGLVTGNNTSIEFTTGTLKLVQFEAGAIVTPFERRDLAKQIEECQFFFLKSYEQSVKPGTASTPGNVMTAATLEANRTFPLSGALSRPMYANPADTFYSPVTGASGKVAGYSSNTDYTISLVGAGGGSNSLPTYLQLSSNPTGAETCVFHVTRDARP